MKAIRLHSPAGLDRLELVDLADPPAPGPGEVQIRIRASSLNYHDYAVVSGGVRVADRLIPLSDGAGEVLAIGDGVKEFKPGDLAVSTFFSDWLKGGPMEGGSPGHPVMESTATPARSSICRLIPSRTPLAAIRRLRPPRSAVQV